MDLFAGRLVDTGVAGLGKGHKGRMGPKYPTVLADGHHAQHPMTEEEARGEVTGVGMAGWCGDGGVAGTLCDEASQPHFCDGASQLHFCDGGVAATGMGWFWLMCFSLIMAGFSKK